MFNQATPYQSRQEPLLALRDFSLTFVGENEDATLALDQVQLEVFPGKTHALVGESGSGKSVTALSILRLIEEIARVRSSGSIVFSGQ